MARILTGIQSTGRPHLGNILGAIKPAVELSKNTSNESLFFIADLHALTTVRDSKLLKENTYAVAAAWLAFGFDTEKNFSTVSRMPRKYVSSPGYSAALLLIQCLPMLIHLRINQAAWQK